MSDANQVQLIVSEEATFGTYLSTSDAQIMAYTGAPRLGVEAKYITSNRIRSTRDVADAVLVDKEAGGDINFELSFGCIDNLIEGALFSDWVNLPSYANATSDTPISNVSEGGGVYTLGTHSILVNHLIRTTGFTNSENNINGAKVTAKDSTTITCDEETTVGESTVPVGARIRVIGIEAETADISSSSTDHSITSAAPLNFSTLGIAAGDWVYLTGLAWSGWCRVASLETVVSGYDKLIFDRYPATFSTDDGTGDTVKIYMGDKITNSTTKKSYTIELKYDDHTSDEYITALGCVVNTLNFELNQADIVKASVNVMGKTGTISTTRTVVAAKEVAATTNTPFNTSSEVGQIALGNTAIASPNYVMRTNISLTNNLRRQQAIGTIGVIGLGAGRCNITGSLNTYFGDKTFVEYSFNATAVGYSIVLDDDSDQHLLIDIPRIKFTGGIPDVSGVDADVMVDLPFQAMIDPDLSYSIKIQRFWYIP